VTNLHQLTSQRITSCRTTWRSYQHRLLWRHSSTHKSAKTHTGTVFVPRDLDLWPLDLNINEFSWLVVVQFCVKFGDLLAARFLRHRADKQTDRQTNKQTNAADENPTSRLASAWVGFYLLPFMVNKDEYNSINRLNFKSAKMLRYFLPMYFTRISGKLSLSSTLCGKDGRNMEVRYCLKVLFFAFFVTEHSWIWTGDRISLSWNFCHDFGCQHYYAGVWAYSCNIGT